jgi:tripartite-type tricarboxylate transporter receptor subunit TctC
MRGLAALLACAAAAQAGAWPEQPVRVLAAVESAEQVARVLGPAMERALGVAIVVERDARAAARTAAAAPDGHTALLLDSGRTLEAAAGLAPVAMVASMPFVILAGPRAGFGSLEGLVEVARHNPGALVYATPGAGSPQHLAAELFFGVAGLQLKHMPYPGTAHAIAATVSNEAQVLVETAAPVLEYVRARSLNALAVTTAARHPELPGAPTAAQAGIANFRAGAWYALAVPAGTRPAVVEGLRAALHAALAEHEVRRRLARAAYEPAAPGTPAELAAHMRAEVARWRAVRAEAGID